MRPNRISRRAGRPTPSFTTTSSAACRARTSGTYSVKLQGYFVLCTGQGIVSGACVPSWTPVGDNQLPFAATVNGQPLTSTDAIESAADAGNVALNNLGPGAVLIGSVTRSN